MVQTGLGWDGVCLTQRGSPGLTGEGWWFRLVSAGMACARSSREAQACPQDSSSGSQDKEHHGTLAQSLISGTSSLFLSDRTFHEPVRILSGEVDSTP